MILEGIVTTVSPAGEINVAPMGPVLPDGWSADHPLERLVLRPFQSSTTFANLRAHTECVLHVTDDVLLLARAAIGTSTLPSMRAAQVVRGWVLADCCRYYELRVVAVDTSTERARMEAAVVHTGRVRDFFGFNRAKHAVVEAAILVTRLHLLPAEEVRSELARLAVLVEKTGGTQERQAFALLESVVRAGPATSPSVGTAS